MTGRVRKAILVPLLLLAATAAVYRIARPMLEADRGSGQPAAAGPTVPSPRSDARSSRARVVDVVDGDTIRVSVNGASETVRLIGVDTPERGTEGNPDQPFYREATEFTRSLCEGREVELTPGVMTADRDRFQRLLRYVTLPDGRSLNAEIIRLGYGFAFAAFRHEHLGEYLHLENEARKAGEGMWSAGRLRTVPWSVAPQYLDEAVTVQGTIVRTHDDGKICFLNFHEDYRKHLSVVVFASDARRFPGDPCTLYDGKRIEVTGLVTEHRGRPQIVARFPEQIR